MQAKSKMAAKVSLPANALSNVFCLHSRFHSNRTGSSFLTRYPGCIHTGKT